jgi:hypothetical protein
LTTQCGSLLANLSRIQRSISFYLSVSSENLMTFEEVCQLPVGGVAIVSKRGHQVCIQRVEQTAFTVEIRDPNDKVILYMVCPATFFEDLASYKNKLSDDTPASSVS